jgi:hypothetical protein
MGWDAEDPVVDQFKPKTDLVEDGSMTISKSTDKQASNDDFSFDFDEAEDDGEKKEIYTVYGHKNNGKTTISYGIPHAGDKILVLSFDRKSTRPKDAPYIVNGKLTISVKDAIKYLDKSSEQRYIESAIKTHAFVLALLDQAKEKFDPDWVMFDGTEVMSGIMELVMRGRNNLKPFQGVANRSLWRERRQYIDDIHNRASQVAKKGVIYTMYSQKDEVIDKDGTVMKKVDIPKWIGSVMEETDIVVHAETKFENNKNVFYARVEGSKLPDRYPDGMYNITNKRFRDVVETKATS